MKLKTGHTEHCMFSLIKPDCPVQYRTPGNLNGKGKNTNCFGGCCGGGQCFVTKIKYLKRDGTALSSKVCSRRKSVSLKRNATRNTKLANITAIRNWRCYIDESRAYASANFKKFSCVEKLDDISSVTKAFGAAAWADFKITRVLI